MPKTQINSNAAASILGVKPDWIRSLIKRGLLTHLNAGGHHRFVQVDYDQVLKLKEKYPTPADLETLIRSGARGKASANYRSSAELCARVDTIQKSIATLTERVELLIQMSSIIESNTGQIARRPYTNGAIPANERNL
jgi:hypothetical protein